MTIIRRAAAVVSAVILTACTAGGHTESVIDKVPPVTLTSNLASDARQVAVDTVVTARAEHGTLTSVTVRYEVDGTERELAGSLDATRSTWTASELLEPGTTYALTAVGESATHQASTHTSSFQTAKLGLDQQIYPSIAPLQGEKVGVGMPVIVSFDRPVTDRAAFQRKLSIESSIPVEGAWSWLNDSTVHFRPRAYWPAGAKVTVVADINGVNAGNDEYGQVSRRVDFTVGPAMVSTVDVAKHVMTVRKNGVVIKKLPITTGKKGFVTRAGTKVVMEKHKIKRMDAATVGIKRGDPDYYNIPDVRWALRVTNSGEFVHAAPWSSGSQGAANVSHGCVGMSTARAKWLYDRSRRGDVIVFKNSPRTLEKGNGWTDWNIPFEEFAAGSAV